MVDSARAIVAHPDLSDGPGRRAPAARLREAEGLAAAIGLDVVHAEVTPVARIRPSTLIGGGAVVRLGEVIAEAKAEVAVVDAALSPIHQRNLERAWDCKVLDRTALILEIFGARARTREGRLQVDLAALSFQKSRLVRSWTHLERQRGGAGFMGGPGERQIESDRRMINDRIGRLQARLADVRRRRDLQRTHRRRRERPLIALVGYTNAGKSTLFNRLTGAGVEARNQLFATLDPTMRAMRLPSGARAVLSDTVGFIADLPTDLIAAFRATLEEVTAADLLLHVRDVSHPDAEAQRRDVLDVLAELGVSADGSPPILEVCNKIDRLPAAERADWAGRPAGPNGFSPDFAEGGDPEEECAEKAEKDEAERAGDSGVIAEPANERWLPPLGPPVRAEPPARVECPIVAVSAANGEGIDRLAEAIERLLARDETQLTLRMDPADGELSAWVYRNARVLSRNDGEGQVMIEAAFGRPALGRLRQTFAGRFTEQVEEDATARKTAAV